ncbi:MAG: hypothetical protein ACLFVX_01415 [Archaeoglobaceae archaeon]
MDGMKVNIWFESVEAEPELYVRQVEVSDVPELLNKLWEQMGYYYSSVGQFLDRVYLSPENIDTVEKLDEYEDTVAHHKG